MKLGDVIKEYRKQNHLSLRAFGASCGLSFQHINAIEHDVYKNPSLETLEAIAKGMDISIFALFSKLDDSENYEFALNNKSLNLISNSVIEAINKNLVQMTVEEQQEVLNYILFLMSKGVKE